MNKRQNVWNLHFEQFFYEKLSRMGIRRHWTWQQSITWTNVNWYVIKKSKGPV